MTNKKSLIALVVILIALVSLRISNLNDTNPKDHKVTTWDAFGYYMYLPSVFIYQDLKELSWVKQVDEKYGVTGGKFYQATQLESSTYTNKYLCGVAILQMPFFLIGHSIAYFAGIPQDGFSWPYQYALMFGAIVWAMIGLIFLRKVLLFYFSDATAQLTLLLIVLSANLIQYISIDAGQSHVYIFTLYAILLWLVLKWHQHPKSAIAFFIGLLCGLATISRPTELIIIFIPLLWGVHSIESAKTKWTLLLQLKNQISISILGGLCGILPQLIYWKYTTDSIIYDVGSKWNFLNPWFRVLFGSEKGWFIYTPIALFMVFGLFFIKKYPFQKAVITFCLLNIWIIISWSDWRYGASYSTRAFTQSYPVFALALAGLIQYALDKNYQKIIYILGLCFIILNVYQIYLYNNISNNFSSPFFSIL